MVRLKFAWLQHTGQRNQWKYGGIAEIAEGDSTIYLPFRARARILFQNLEWGFACFSLSSGLNGFSGFPSFLVSPPAGPAPKSLRRRLRAQPSRWPNPG